MKLMNICSFRVVLPSGGVVELRDTTTYHMVEIIQDNCKGLDFGSLAMRISDNQLAFEECSYDPPRTFSQVYGKVFQFEFTHYAIGYITFAHFLEDIRSNFIRCSFQELKHRTTKICLPGNTDAVVLETSYW